MKISGFERAKALFSGGEYTCVLSDGERVITSKKSGVAPLLELIESGRELKGYSAADKIVGKAAALLYAYMGVERVYSAVLSVAALRVFEERGIAAEYATLTDSIINRRGDGICPMEQAVLNIDDPAEGLAAIKKRVAELKK